MYKYISEPSGYCPIVAYQDRIDWLQCQATTYYHRAMDTSLSSNLSEYLYEEYSVRVELAKWHMK